MGDARLKHLQRAWATDPADPELLASLIAAHRRLGERIPAEVRPHRGTIGTQDLDIC